MDQPRQLNKTNSKKFAKSSKNKNLLNFLYFYPQARISKNLLYFPPEIGISKKNLYFLKTEISFHFVRKMYIFFIFSEKQKFWSILLKKSNFFYSLKTEILVHSIKIFIFYIYQNRNF